MQNEMELTCNCGQVVMQFRGKPILSAECLCSDCQKAGAFLQKLPGAPAVLDDKSATPFVLYRKDRVRCLKGAELLREYRLTQASKTRRVIASCCNTPVLLEFSGGHWVSVFGVLWPEGTLPPPELRTMTKEAPEDVILPPDIPNPKTHTFGFYAKLFGAWAGMGFRAPKIDYVKGSIDAC